MLLQISGAEILGTFVVEGLVFVERLRDRVLFGAATEELEWCAS